MAWVYIDKLGGHENADVTIRGWLVGRRSSGKIHFLQIRDGTGICQCVATISDLGAEAFAAADHIQQETSLEVSGVVRADKRAPGGYELDVTDASPFSWTIGILRSDHRNSMRYSKCATKWKRRFTTSSHRAGS